MKIAVMTSQVLKDSLVQCIKEVSSLDRFAFYVYDDLGEMDDIYIRHGNEMSGLLFTGNIPYGYFQLRFPECKLPAVHVPNPSLAKACLYMMRHQLEYPEIPLRELFCDFAGDVHHSALMTEVLPAGHFPHTVRNFLLNGDFYTKLSAAVLELYRQGTVKRAFLTLSNMYEKLHAAGMPCQLVTAEPEQMMGAINQLLSLVDGIWQSQESTLMAVIDFSRDDDIGGNFLELEYREATIVKVLVDYKKRYGGEMGPSIVKSGGMIEITMPSGESRKELFAPILSCLSYLREQLPHPFSVGVGSGSDIQHCREQAFQALHYAYEFGSGCIFGKQRDQLTGPLLDDSCLDMDCSLIAMTAGLAKKLGISNLNYVRMLSLLKEQDVTSERVARYLNVTVRSANRIITILLEHGVVRETSPGEKSPRKGRPTKYYTMANNIRVRS